MLKNLNQIIRYGQICRCQTGVNIDARSSQYLLWCEDTEASKLQFVDYRKQQKDLDRPLRSSSRCVGSKLAGFVSLQVHNSLDSDRSIIAKLGHSLSASKIVV